MGLKLLKAKFLVARFRQASQLRRTSMPMRHPWLITHGLDGQATGTKTSIATKTTEDSYIPLKIQTVKSLAIVSIGVIRWVGNERRGKKEHSWRCAAINSAQCGPKKVTTMSNFVLNLLSLERLWEAAARSSTQLLDSSHSTSRPKLLRTHIVCRNRTCQKIVQRREYVFSLQLGAVNANIYTQVIANAVTTEQNL